MIKRISYVVASLSLLVAACARPPPSDAGLAGIRLLAQAPDAPEFERALNVREFEFPRDHGSHDNFATEWWYFTGNLTSGETRHFGFELTFFRYALSASAPERASQWASNQVWLAHFAFTDTLNEQFFATQRMGRGALDIAGAQSDQLSVHVRDWSARSSANLSTISLQAVSAGAGIKLELSDAAPIALHGNRGLDRKGREPGNASYYYSIPRMTAAGTVTLASGETISVAGAAWLDREWATSSLDAGVEGWDWFGLQLDDGTDLMLYRLRNSDGSRNPFSTGSLMERGRTSVQLEADEVSYTVLDHWTSPASRVTYPVQWQISVPSRGIELIVSPRISNQELNLDLRYWEGAVIVTGSVKDEVVSGVGYLELAGY